MKLPTEKALSFTERDLAMKFVDAVAAGNENTAQIIWDALGKRILLWERQRGDKREPHSAQCNTALMAAFLHGRAAWAKRLVDAASDEQLARHPLFHLAAEGPLIELEGDEPSDTLGAIQALLPRVSPQLSYGKALTPLGAAAHFGRMNLFKALLPLADIHALGDGEQKDKPSVIESALDALCGGRGDEVFEFCWAQEGDLAPNQKEIDALLFRAFENLDLAHSEKTPRIEQAIEKILPEASNDGLAAASAWLKKRNPSRFSMVEAEREARALRSVVSEAAKGELGESASANASVEAPARRL